MDWHVSPAARQSGVSGQPFETGTRVISFLLRDPETGEWHRRDVLASERDSFAPDGTILGWWERTVKTREEEEEAAFRRQRFQDAESLFLSLFEGEGEVEEEGSRRPDPAGIIPDFKAPEAAGKECFTPDQAEADRGLLKQLLALMLERKRVLKRAPVADRAAERAPFQRLVHVRTGKSFDVPDSDMPPERLLALGAILDPLLKD